MSRTLIMRNPLSLNSSLAHNSAAPFSNLNPWQLSFFFFYPYLSSLLSFSLPSVVISSFTHLPHHSLIHPFIRSFICSFVRSCHSTNLLFLHFFRSFVCPFIGCLTVFGNRVMFYRDTIEIERVSMKLHETR